MIDDSIHSLMVENLISQTNAVFNQYLDHYFPGENHRSKQFAEKVKGQFEERVYPGGEVNYTHNGKVIFARRSLPLPRYGFELVEVWKINAL